jgi:hypothetical protein
LIHRFAMTPAPKAGTGVIRLTAMRAAARERNAAP